MIVYDPDSNWLRDVLNFYKSKTLVWILVRSLLVGGYMALATWLSMDVYHLVIDISPILYTSVGIGFSILLVFRTNTAYDRWWEGRKKWGLLVNHTRHLALILDGLLPKTDEGNRKYFARHITNYPFTLATHLRGRKSKKDRLNLSEKEQEEFQKVYHKPNYISKKLIQGITGLKKDNKITGFEELQVHDCLLEFSNITGACERIKNTPIPFSYNTYIKIFILIYTASLPLAFETILGYYTIILGVFEFFFLTGVEMMAEEIEDPFDDTHNDLPMIDLSQKIKGNVYEIFEMHDHVEAPKKYELYEVIS